MYRRKKPFKPRSKSWEYQEEITPGMALDILNRLEALRKRTPLTMREVYDGFCPFIVGRQMQRASGVTPETAARLKKLARMFLLDEED